MLHQFSLDGEGPDNPFTPDFGQQPLKLAGRDGLMSSLREGLTSGPVDPRFTSMLLGPRGSGKTVILNHLRDEAQMSGWIVLSLDASTSGIRERIVEHIAWTREAHESLPNAENDLTERRALKFKMFPFEWQREAVRAVRPKWGLRRQLTELSDHASRHDTALLLLVDEMHSGDTTELRRLAADLQHITKGDGLPLAFLGAGLSEMKHTLLEDKWMTFFARCNRQDMPPLSRIDAERFLGGAVRDAGGSFEGDALDALTAAAGSLPYKMQLVGSNAWEAADAPTHPIGERAAQVAVAEANRLMHERVSLPAWHALNETERAYLRRVVELGGGALPQQIAEGISASPRTLARAWRHLVNVGCINTETGGTVRVADIISVSSIEQVTAEEEMHSSAGAAVQRIDASHRCNAWMPRSHARCLLSQGHSGGHRSR